MRKVKESKLTHRMREVLENKIGGAWQKIHGGMYQTVGLPDLVGCVKGFFVAIEVKTPDNAGNLTERQKLILTRITEAGGLAFSTSSVDEAVVKVQNFLLERERKI